MNRREAIRNIALAAAATAFLPGCSETPVTDQILAGNLRLDQQHSDYLSAISETFLPVRGVSNRIPNATPYMLKMLNNCHAPEEVGNFAAGFEQYKKLMSQARLDIQDADANAVIAKVEEILEQDAPESELVYFITTVRELSIKNLVTSEYYQTVYAEYKLIPDQYIACQDLDVG